MAATWVNARSSTTIPAGSSPSSTSSRSRPARRLASATFDPELGIVREARQLGLLVLPLLAIVDGQKQLDGWRSLRLLDERGERLEAREQAPPDRVGRGDQAGRRPEVPGQGQCHAIGFISIGEAAVLLSVDLDVGVAEAVDRLELVADQEEARVRAAQLLDQPQLEAVRVLELVDHQVVELLAVAIAQGLR